tara:strand:+ start:306 stop:1184 length:879 start_codon:yes stop_codon:yes gene_type:complete
MISIRTLKTLLVVSLFSLVAGCKIAVMVVEGGEVEVGYPSGTVCETGTICINQVNSTTYSEVFVAKPDAGWRFVKWSSGDSFLCADTTSPTCTLSNIPLAGIPAVEAIVDSSETFYLMPLFAPLTEIGSTVTMNGKEWAPLTSFGDLTWDEIDAVCPVTNGGHCLAGGKLMEYDMTGWTWASVDDVNDLINAYSGASPIGPGPDELPGASIGLGFWYEFNFPETSSTQDCGGCSTLTWNGWTSTAAGVSGQAHLAEVYYTASVQVGTLDGYATTLLTDAVSGGHSAWFYRTP